MLGETKELSGIKIKYPASIDFAEMMGQLAQPGAFPFALSESEVITVLQTHASTVVLTPSRVYKVKKPKNFGFLNFSTPLLRLPLMDVLISMMPSALIGRPIMHMRSQT